VATVLSNDSTESAPSAASSRGYWLRTLYQWHWLSSAACLIVLLVFAVTGITLNHAASIEARPSVVTRDGVLPPDVLATVRVTRRDGKGPLPKALEDWLATTFSIAPRPRDGEWSEHEVYVALPRPGGDAWATVALDSGRVEYEVTDRGWVAYLNDLHKGRNTGAAWAWFIDVFAAACLVFAGTGLCLLYLHGRARSSTWPMVTLGVVLPLLILILFVH
jgi:hypothetical protein